jgi:hypothetical protein
MRAIERRLSPSKPRIVPVHAEEMGGRNKIPMAYGEVIANVLRLDTDPGIVQSSVANHSNSPSIYHRLVSSPTFSGFVEKGVDYFLVDDTCTAGGTLASLRGFIEGSGGRVALMSVLALNNLNRAYDMSLSETTLLQLRRKHPQLDAWWGEEFGYGIDCLTEGEAGHLRSAPSFDTIRSRIIEARRDLNLNGNEGAPSGAAKETEVVDRSHNSTSPSQNGG